MWAGPERPVPISNKRGEVMRGCHGDDLTLYSPPREAKTVQNNPAITLMMKMRRRRMGGFK